jgi:hypothetical protein
MFSITDNKGFQIKFANGLAVSVQFGYGNYCENRDMRGGYGAAAPPSKTAEVAVIGPNGLLKLATSDTVEGWCSPEVVADLIAWTQAAPADAKEVPALVFARHS